jgi:hypothetical protein
MSYVLNFTLQQFTLLGIELQVGLSYSLKNQLEVSKMFLICLPKYYDVVNKDTAYVGHVVSEEGIEIDQGKTDKVVNWPTPTTPEDVRRFLGFVGYYRRFIHNFSKISRPLTSSFLVLFQNFNLMVSRLHV